MKFILTVKAIVVTPTIAVRCRRMRPLLLLLIPALMQLHIDLHGQELPHSFGTRITNIDTSEINDLINKASNIHDNLPDSAYILLHQALLSSKAGNYRQGIILSYLGLAFNRYDSRNFQAGKRYVDSAYFYCFLPSVIPLDQRVPALVNNCMAAYHTLVGNNNTAITYYYASLKYLDKHNAKHKEQIIAIYNNIGGTFMLLNQPGKALYYCHKSEELALQANDSQQLHAAYHNLASSYQAKAAYAQAEIYYKRAIAYYKRNGQHLNLQDAYYGLARNFLLITRPKEALANFLLAVSADSVAAKNNSSLFQGIGGAYYMLGKYKLAEQQYKTALELCEQEHLVLDKLTIYSSLGKIYDKTGKHQLAYTNQVAFSDLYDSLYKEKIVKATNELEVNYRVAEKDKDIAQKQVLLLQQQNRIREKNLWLTGIVAGALFLIVIIIGLFRNRRHKEHLQKQHILNLEKEKEIHALKAKAEGEEEERTRLARDLHDGVVVQFSAIKMNLSVLPEEHPSLLQTDDFHKIVTNLDQATRDLRKTAHNLMPDTLLESGLSEAVFFFCKDLQQNSRLIIDFQQYVEIPRLRTDVELSLYRIIQELLQNVVKHARATKAIVQLSYNEQLLQVTIEDDGIGFQAAAQLSRQRGIGIKNVYARMSGLSGKVEIENRERGSTIYLELDTGMYLI